MGGLLDTGARGDLAPSPGTFDHEWRSLWLSELDTAGIYWVEARVVALCSPLPTKNPGPECEQQQGCETPVSRMGGTAAWESWADRQHGLDTGAEWPWSRVAMDKRKCTMSSAWTHFPETALFWTSDCGTEITHFCPAFMFPVDKTGQPRPGRALATFRQPPGNPPRKASALGSPLFSDSY